MNATPEKTGCAARALDFLLGIATGWSCAALVAGRLATPPRAAGWAELLGAVLGAVAGALLPELIRALEREGVRREASRTAFSLITAAILSAAFGAIVVDGCITGMLVLSFATCLLFFVDAAVGGSAGFIAPLVHGARKELGEILLKAIAGVVIGMTAGILRIELDVLAITSPADGKLYGAVVLAAGVLSYPLLLLLARGREAVRGIRLVVPVLDGLLFAMLIGALVAQPTPSLSPSWSETIERGNGVWVPLGMLLGGLITFAFGGIQSVLGLLLANPVSFLWEAFADGVEDLLGRPIRKKEVAAPPPAAVSRTASGCIGTIAFVGMLCFGLMAMCFHGSEKESDQDDRDVARLRAPCPPSCAGGDFSGWSLARTDRMRGANFDGANLRATILWGADLSNARFRKARMRGAQLMFARFRAADLTDADLRSAVLTGADLEKAVLRRANLRGALLQTAKLTGADLRDARLEGAVFDAATVWPKGFDPRAAGARMDGEK